MTILGEHTAHELAVDSTNWNGFVSTMAQSVANDGPKWQAADATGWAAWEADWQAFSARWATQLAAIVAVIASAQSSLLGWDYTTAESDYAQTLQTFQNGTVPSPGGYDDLYRRWVAANKAPPPPVQVTVDPNTAADADLGAYEAADTAAKTVSAAVPGLGPPMPLSEKIAIGLAAAVLIGIIIKVAK